MDAPEPAAKQAPSRPEGWQFSPFAVFAREVTAVLFGPFLSFVVRGPAVVGAGHLAELDGPVLMCPTHASHFDVSVLRLAVRRHHRHHLAAAAAADYFKASRWRWFFAA